MRKITAVFALIGFIAFQACEGPMGPQGEPGINIVGETFEVSANFNAQNGYSQQFNFTEDLVSGDMVLGFVLWGQDGQHDVWRPMPQTAYDNGGGILVYNYDFTIKDVRVFLDGNIDFSQLDASWTQNQIFRFMVVPSDLVNARMDWTDYEAVTKFLGVNDDDFVKISAGN